MMDPSRKAFPMAMAAGMGAAIAATIKSLRLLLLESNSRRSLDFTDEGYVFLNRAHHVQDAEFGERSLAF